MTDARREEAFRFLPRIIDPFLVVEVAMRSSPFLIVDKQGVIGALKATGSTDPDVLHAAKGKLLGAAGTPRLWGFLVLGGAAVAIWGRAGLLAAGLALAGCWFVYRGIRNVRMVEAGYAEYSATLREVRTQGRQLSMFPGERSGYR